MTDERRDGSGAAVLWLLTAATLWGAIGPVAEFAFAAGVLPLGIAFWRAALAAPVFGLLWLRARGPRPGARDAGAITLFGVVGIAGMYGCFFVAVEAGGAPLAAALLYTGPAWVAVYQRARHARPLGRAGRLALLLSLAGVVILTGAGGAARPPLLAVVAGLGSGLAFATHFTLAPPFLARYGSPLVFALAMAAAGVVLALFTPVTVPALAAAPAVAFIVLGSTVGASLAFGRAVVRLAPVRAAVLSNWEPVVAMVLSGLVWSHPIGLRQIAGASLIVAAAVIVAARRPPGPG